VRSEEVSLPFEKVNGMLSLHAVPDAFTTSECELIIARISEAPTDEALLVGRNKDHNLRKAELVWTDNVVGMEWVMERLIEIVRRSNRDRFEFDLCEFAESPQVAIYKSSNSGHFAWHSDIGAGHTSGKRKLTLVLQLSGADTYEGGNLEIMPGAQILTANRAQGCISVFPSFTLHQVTPVISGIRYSMTVWAHGPAFR
jgi:PKHD-type hydroxylase